MLKREIAVAWILSKDKKHLVGSTNPEKGGVYTDKYHQPGGGIEEGETAEEALIREVEEETGLNIRNDKITLIDDTQVAKTKKKLANGEIVDCQMHFIVYLVEIDKLAQDIKVKAGDDMQDLRWVSIDELEADQLTPPAKLILGKLGWGKQEVEDSYITIDDFAKVELRVGLVKEATEPEWSHKLIRQVVDFGEEIGERIIFSGLRKWYSADDFIDRKLVYVTNLAPRKMGEEASEGMILAVEDADGMPIRWDVSETSIAPGTRVG